MKKLNLWSLLVALFVVLAMFASPFAPSAAAVELGPVSSEARASLGATHFLSFTHEDLTETSTNTAQTLSNFGVSADTAVEFVVAVLDEPFTTGDTNYTGSTAITVGDGSDADLYLSSTELNSDGTEVYVAWPPVGTVTVGATGEVTSVTSLGRKLYTASDTVDVVVTPNAEEALSALTNGAVRLYFKLINPYEL